MYAPVFLRQFRRYRRDLELTCGNSRKPWPSFTSNILHGAVGDLYSISTGMPSFKNLRIAKPQNHVNPTFFTNGAYKHTPSQPTTTNPNPQPKLKPT